VLSLLGRLQKLGKNLRGSQTFAPGELGELLQKKRYEKMVKQLTKSTEAGNLIWRSNRKKEDEPPRGTAGGGILVYSYPFSSKLIIEISRSLDKLSLGIRYNFNILDTYEGGCLKNLFKAVDNIFVNQELEQAFDDIEEALKEFV